MSNIGIVNPTISTQNSMQGEQTHASTFEPTKPLLKRVLDLYISYEKTGNRTSHNILDRLEHKSAEHKIWTKTEMDHFMTVANRTWMEHAWNSLKTVADCFLSVVSFGMGGYLLANGSTTEGNFLIVAGIFNILQTVFARLGMWDWISETLAEKNEATRDRLKIAFPIIVSVLGFAFSVAGSKYIQMNELIKGLEHFKTVIAMGGQGMSSYLTIKKGYDDAQNPGIQAELKQHEQTIDVLGRLVDYFIKESRRIKSMIKKPFNALMQASTLAAQKA